MIPVPNQVTHRMKYHALLISKINPNTIASNGNSIKSSMVITCRIVFERFISMVYHIFIDDLLPL